MPTKYKNPRLLLIQGILGQSSGGLSSFDSMEQEKDYLKFVIEMLDLCHPNVVFVGKIVSPDIQESILAKGMTLVFDMKRHCLERVARYTGSPILSPDTMMSKNLKQCDSFRIENFIEGHAGSGGKELSKTLMFIEDSCTRLGCTVLLKAAQSDALKIKSVVQCAVFLAYHLILETAFFVDQRATLSYADVATDLPTDKEALTLGSVKLLTHVFLRIQTLVLTMNLMQLIFSFPMNPMKDVLTVRPWNSKATPHSTYHTILLYFLGSHPFR